MSFTFTASNTLASMFSPVATDINPSYFGNRIKRLIAFCVDIFPINFVAILVYRQFSDYDSVMESFMADPQDEALSEAAMAIMNKIGMIGGGLYLLYCFLMEASVHQATFGKRLMRLKVVNVDGSILTPKEAFWRNAFKIFSHAAFSIGFFWIFFDRQKRGWHDIMGKTLVVDQSYESTIPEDLIWQLEEIKESPYRNTTSTLTNSNFNTLEEGNQSNLLYTPRITVADFEQIKFNYPNPIDRVKEYKLFLIDIVLESNNNIPADLLWNNCTYGQKVLWAFFAFDEHTCTTDLFSFIFYRSEFIYVMLDVLQTIDATELLLDYRHVVREFEEEKDTFIANKKIYENPLTGKKEKQSAYHTAQIAIPFAYNIDNYYKEHTHQTELYQKVCDYIEHNSRMFIRSNT